MSSSRGITGIISGTKAKRVLTAVVAAGALTALAACGGSDSDDAAGSDGGDVSNTVGAGDTGGGAVTSAGSSGSSGTYTEGPVAIRVVNLLDESVDVYVRTDGFVEAFSVHAGLVAGEVSEFYNPPQDGKLVVTTAGAGDPECVIDCPHFLAEVSTSPDYGPVHTLILTLDDGVPSSLDLWEQPSVSFGNANEMVPADPSESIVVVTGYAVDDADFGMRMAIVGTAGCVEPFNLSGILIGGNQTPAFTLPSPSVEVTIHDNTDRDCSGTPVGSPFTLDVAAGERAHVILHGSLADGVEAIILPME